MLFPLDGAVKLAPAGMPHEEITQNCFLIDNEYYDM